MWERIIKSNSPLQNTADIWFAFWYTMYIVTTYYMFTKPCGWISLKIHEFNDYHTTNLLHKYELTFDRDRGGRERAGEQWARLQLYNKL